MLRLLAQIKINRVFSVLSRLYLAKSKHRVVALYFSHIWKSLRKRNPSQGERAEEEA